ncbi:MAG TPA: cytochrome o ubiquinol oxidase subunit III [Candidatus Saccharimonadales bacterium]|jgi:cytochrome o ubiquinol oxidase subunit 3|nr:cytochrome o ubiquinol oxidase subunit III [Candidatus Saccharimonadales bacterium]
MSEATSVAAANERQEAASKTLFGFWVYLMTDCVLFASLFAAFAVLRDNTYGGPSGNELFSLPFVLIETLALLTSSYTAGLGLLAARRRNRQQVLIFFSLTMLLGIFFLTMELTEFHKLYIEGNSWRRSGFLSAFFTLVGTHGAHILTGLTWMAIMMYKVLKGGLTNLTIKRLSMLSLFWHFLDVIWIFIFTIVYLFGVAV